jgi:hypothetical protein
MTLSNLSLEVGRNLGYLNAARDAWITNRGIIEADVKAWINFVYRDDLFLSLASRHKWYFEQEATFTSYIATGSIDSVSTTTLVATTAIFNNAMEGLYVYNETQEESAIVSAYVSTTQLTMESDVSTWEAGDTIYVMGQEFIIGDADDLVGIEFVGLKYSSANTDYAVAEKRTKDELQDPGDLTYSESFPKWYNITLLDDTTRKWGIGIYPAFQDSTATGVIRYIKKPDTLTDDLEPFLPVDDLLIAGATKKAYQAMQDAEGIAIWGSEYTRLKGEFVMNFNPSKYGSSPRIRQTRRMYNLRSRAR